MKSNTRRPSSNFSLAGIPLHQLPGAQYLQMADHRDNTVMNIRSLDKELYNACESKSFEDIRNIVKRSINETKKNFTFYFRKDYYLMLDFLLGHLENSYRNVLLDIIKESLLYNNGNEEYGEACGSLLKFSTRKGASHILEVILSKLDDMIVDKSELRHWLNRKDKCGQTVLTHVILSQGEENTGIDCMNILINYKQYIDIDVVDYNGNTALHYAVEDNGIVDRTLAKTLIMNGACMNIDNKEGKCAMDRISAMTLENILNECIQEPNGSSNNRTNEDYELKMDFKIFSHKDSMDDRNQSEFIRALDSTESRHHLLYHPLITTFLHIKWQRVKYIWYLNFLFNMIFYSLILFYMYFHRQVLEDATRITKETPLTQTLRIVISILGIIPMARETIQFFHFKMNYLKCFENYLEVSIVILTYCMFYARIIKNYQNIVAWLVIFISVEFFLLLEKLHSLKISLYVSMFRKVTYNFVKLTILLIGMVLAFAIAFLTLIPIELKGGTVNKHNETQEINPCEYKHPNTLKDAFIKTLLMATGEYEYSNLDFYKFPASSLLFTVFIFLICLVAMNLLNGIAVSDVQAIQDDAIKYRVEDQVESILNFDNLKPIFRFLCCLNIWEMGQVFSCFPEKVITFNPNRYKGHHLRCMGHEDYYHTNTFHYLKVYKWFKHQFWNKKQCLGCKRYSYMLGCNKCGDAKNICLECSDKYQQDEHICVYKHKYKIPTTYVIQAKLRKEKTQKKKEKKEEKIKSKDLKQRLLNIDERTTRIENDFCHRLMNIEKNLESLIEQKVKL